jgi:DNA-binding transcriptional ArsR family regulator
METKAASPIESPIETQIEAVDALSALAQERRLAVFRLLVKAGPDGMAAGEIARRLEMFPNTLSSALAILERAGLIEARRAGRSILYAPSLPRMRALLGFLLEDCCDGRPEICLPVAERAQSICKC